MKTMAMHSMHLVALALGFVLVATPARAQEEVIYYHTDAIGSVRASDPVKGFLGKVDGRDVAFFVYKVADGPGKSPPQSSLPATS